MKRLVPFLIIALMSPLTGPSVAHATLDDATNGISAPLIGSAALSTTGSLVKYFRIKRQLKKKLPQIGERVSVTQIRHAQPLIDGKPAAYAAEDLNRVARELKPGSIVTFQSATRQRGFMQTPEGPRRAGARPHTEFIVPKKLAAEGQEVTEKLVASRSKWLENMAQKSGAHFRTHAFVQDAGRVRHVGVRAATNHKLLEEIRVLQGKRPVFGKLSWIAPLTFLAYPIYEYFQPQAVYNKPNVKDLSTEGGAPPEDVENAGANPVF